MQLRMAVMLALVGATTLTMVGCVEEPPPPPRRVVYVEGPPPPPPPPQQVVVEEQVAPMAPPQAEVEVIPAQRPGYFWARGYWRWNGRGYVAVRGHWEPVRPGYRYVHPHWEQGRDGGWHFRGGVWVSA